MTRPTASLGPREGATRKAVARCGRTRTYLASLSVKDTTLYSRPPSIFLRCRKCQCPSAWDNNLLWLGSYRQREVRGQRLRQVQETESRWALIRRYGIRVSLFVLIAHPMPLLAVPSTTFSRLRERSAGAYIGHRRNGATTHL